MSLDAISELLGRHSEQVLLVDEAYADFGAQSALSIIDQHPNLLVSHTFSKGRSLAGLRLGVAYGHVDLIEGLKRVKNSFNSYPVDVLAQAAGVASIKDETYYRETINTIINTRNRATATLQARGFEVLPSAANFIFVKPGDNDASALFDSLSSAGVLVRYWAKPRLDQWLRISIGTAEDMGRLMRCLNA